MVVGDTEGDDAGEHADWLVWKEAVVEGRTAVYGEAGAGMPALFFHGMGLGHKSYKRSLSRLVRAGLHVYAPALPGFGGTASLPAQSATMAGYGDWAAAFMRTVGITRPALVMGHSFGGGVAISLAHGHRHHVRALVLINSIGGSAWYQSSWYRALTQRPPWDWGLHFHADLLPVRQARRILPVILSEAIPNVLRDPRSFVRAAGLARWANLTAELEALRRRRLPVVVLWGSRDQLVTKRSFEDMCRALGDPNVITVPGAHSWLLADPDEFGEVMTNVLDVVGLVAPVPALPSTVAAGGV
jgi:pimeloyl-ACP methyl ester carboxylesterase